MKVGHQFYPLNSLKATTVAFSSKNLKNWGKFARIRILH